MVSTTAHRPPLYRPAPGRPSLDRPSLDRPALDRPARDRPAPGRPALRLTRRGRAVVLVFFVLLASAASAVLFATASRANRPETGPVPTVVVQPHDTLWSIATRTAPHRDPYAAVAELQRLNHLPDYVVHPGETLVLPRGR